MIVLGIDPGSRRCGYGIVARQGVRLSRVASGVIVPGDLAMAERLACILQGLSDLLAPGRVDAVAIETAYCGRSARSALALGQARGVALAVVARAGVPVFEYAPGEVKRAFTGNGRAEKPQMVRTARALFGIAPRLSDEADALAIAVCHLARATLLPRSRPARPGEPARALSSAAERARRFLRPAVRRFGGAT